MTMDTYTQGLAGLCGNYGDGIAKVHALGGGICTMHSDEEIVV